MPAVLRRPPDMAGALISLGLIVATVPAAAQSTPDNQIVVTATRSPLEIARSGSAVSVILAEEIQEKGARSIAEVFRALPGVDVSESGGVGAVTNITIRGSNPGQTLILVDGIRVGDSTAIGGEFDFGAFGATDIERIEVLRGPQSALYGSDAMGGVINIITRKGAGAPRASIAVEGGSYGSKGIRASLSGSTETVNYAFSLNGVDTAGFSRFGYRLGRLTPTLIAPLENDPTRRLAGSARIGWRPVDGVEIEAGATTYWSNIAFDGFGADDRFNRQRSLVSEGWTKGSLVSFGGVLKTSLTLFGGRTDRNYGFSGEGYSPPFASDYRGNRYGAELQNDLKLGTYGLLVFGARTETETAAIWTQPLPRGSALRVQDVDARQTTNALFALWQLPVGERLNLSLGGRVDDVADNTFATWRATAAYDLRETNTKLRASIGTGAKAPSLYQLYNPYDPTRGAGLQPEESLGIDAGIDQFAFDNWLKLSVGVFWNRYRNLIEFRDLAFFPVYQAQYYNVGRAETKGVEASADLVLVPGEWRARGTYTFMIAKDLETGLSLLRRPRNKGSVGLIYSGVPKLEIEGRVLMVGPRPDYNLGNRVRLAPYARLDLWARYDLDATWQLYARAENVTNAHYEEAYSYGTTGRAVFAGLRAQW